MSDAAEMKGRPSFSGVKRWVIRLQVAMAVLVVIAIVLMLNYLGRDYFRRLHWSSLKANELSPMTVRFVKSLTNEVKVTLYYDRAEPSLGDVVTLLNEYNALNHRITVEMVDYLRDPGAARRIKEQYKLVLPTQTNLVIFDSGGRPFAVDGNAITKYRLERVPSSKDLLFDKKPVAFEGERKFMQALLAVTSSKPLN